MPIPREAIAKALAKTPDEPPLPRSRHVRARIAAMEPRICGRCRGVCIETPTRITITTPNGTIRSGWACSDCASELQRFFMPTRATGGAA